MAYSFLNFDKLLEKEKLVSEKFVTESQIETIDFKKDDLIKKMIKYIEFQVGDKYAENNIKNLLDVFSLMIQESTETKEIQDVFNNNKAIEMVLFLLSRKQSLEDEFLKTLLVFCNSMLFQRNLKVQRTIYKHFKNSKQTERIFERFSQYIRIVSNHIKDEHFGKIDRVEYGSFEITIEILKFLKVSCEGHYLEMQDFFRFQPNFSNQYNFLKEIVDLLNILSTKITANVYDLLLLCFDSLTKLVQGPNRLNQDFMLKSPILEILSRFLMQTTASNSKSKTNHTDVSSELSPQSIRKIKFKSIVLLESLCELAEYNKDVYSRISKFFPIYLMLAYLEESYTDYTRLYGNEFVMDSLNKVN